MMNSHKVTKHACTSSWSPLAHSIHHTYHQVTVMNKQQKNKGYKQLIYIYISHVNVTQTVPDISPLMPMHQDPLLVCYMAAILFRPQCALQKFVLSWLHVNAVTPHSTVALKRYRVHIHFNGPLTRYAKLGVAHTPGMSVTFSQPPTSEETAS